MEAYFRLGSENKVERGAQAVADKKDELPKEKNKKEQSAVHKARWDFAFLMQLNRNHLKCSFSYQC